jgi:hypothetical protein
MDVCLLWVLCDVRLRSLRRAGPSSRGVLPTVVCLSVCDHETSTKRRGPGPYKAVEQYKVYFKLSSHLHQILSNGLAFYLFQQQLCTRFWSPAYLLHVMPVSPPLWLLHPYNILWRADVTNFLHSPPIPYLLFLYPFRSTFYPITCNILFSPLRDRPSTVQNKIEHFIIFIINKLF